MTFEIRQGDALTRLREMPDESVHCVVTSPPYWGLRDYGTAEWAGGDPACAHRGRVNPKRDTSGGDNGRFAATRGTQPAKDYSKPLLRACGCGAVREDAQIGLEESPRAYVECLAEVFAEVHRVLRADGTCWLNLGDCYLTVSHGPKGFNTSDPRAPHARKRLGDQANRLPQVGFKHKDLMGMPWRVAFALQEAGWYLRCDVIWHKRAPMPESVRDRPTRAHEYVFFLTKRPRYFYDANAIREPLAVDGKQRRYKSGNGFTGRQGGSSRVGPLSGGACSTAKWDGEVGGRNARSVWTLGPEPFPEAHFAVMPTELVRPCILAGSPYGGVVLDPFAGAGTVGLVAVRHGRSFIGIELNPKYVEMATRRISSDAPLFARPLVEESL